MNSKQRETIKKICNKLGSSKTRSLIELLGNGKHDDISSIEIQDLIGLDPQYSKELLELLNSFESMESFCVAMEMQDEMDSKKFIDSKNTKLVMTGPISGSNIGNTLGNFKKIIETAKSEIILVGYVFRNIDGQMDPIINSLMFATSRGIDVKIFFEKGSSAKSLNDIWKKSKSYEIPELYVYKPKEKNSVLHAKVLIKDDDTIFVTSANMTGSAMERNIELGILNEGTLASDAKKMLYELVRRGYMVKIN